MAWNLWTVNESITHGRNPYSTDLIFYPLGSRLSYHTLAAGFFPLTFLAKKILPGNPLYPIYAYRIIILVSFTLILFSSYVLLRQLGFQGWPALIPSIAYAFCGFYTLHVLHLNHIAGFFIPLTALFLVRLYKRPSGLNALLGVTIPCLAIYFTELALYLYFGIAVFLVLMFASTHTRTGINKTLEVLGVKRLLVCAGFAALLLAPFLVNLSITHVLKPLPWESSYYSANLAGFFVPLQTDSPLYGAIFRPLSSRITEGMGEAGIFIGFPMLILGVLGLIDSGKKHVYLCGLMSMLFFLLSLGPTLKVFNRDTGLPLPYALLMNVPPFNSGRAPVRFVVMAMFFLMIVSAAGVTSLYRITRALSGRRWSALVMSFLFAWTVAEASSPCPRQQPFVPPAALRNVIDGPVLNLPLNRNDGYALLLQIFHHQPIGTGYVARSSTEQAQRFSELERLVRKGGAGFCNGIIAMGFRNILIAREDIVPGAPGVAPLDLARCGVNIVDLRSNTGRLSGPERPNRFPFYAPGMKLDLRSHESDRYLWYGWSDPEKSFRWTEGDSAAVIFALQDQKPLLMRIRMAPFLAWDKLEAQELGIELNGQWVAKLRLSDQEAREYSIAIPAAAVKTLNTLRFDMPDAESPASLGISLDDRLLGISVEWLELDEVPK